MNRKIWLVFPLCMPDTFIYLQFILPKNQAYEEIFNKHEKICWASESIFFW